MTFKVLVVTALLVACGDDDGGAGLPDAPRSDAALIDASLDVAPDAMVTLTTDTTFAGGIGSLCGIAFDQTDNSVWAYACNAATINHYSAAGAPLGTVARPGEVTDDVDLEIAPGAFTLSTATLAAGDLMFINGETGTAELYVPEASASSALAPGYGNSHVVGGAFHLARNTIFLVQDRNAGAAANQIAEIDPITGATVNTFVTTPAYVVNFGDLDICASTGHLFVVSSVETTIAELTPTGALVAKYPLPAGVAGASGIGLDDATGAAWISGIDGSAVRMLGLPCG